MKTDLPKDIEVRRVYEPDMAAMVKALKLVLEIEPKQTSEPNIQAS